MSASAKAQKIRKVNFTFVKTISIAGQTEQKKY